ncbi:MAG: hypothetical protein J1E64_07905 [Acetatifactor sp.]|nr:hypothetical protein [Acetatifactor sp.]
MKKMKKMKKLVSLLLVLVMCATLAACGSKGNTTSGTPSSAPSSTDGPTDAQLQALTNAYNQVAVLYNDVAITADANGWTADEETTAAIQTIGDMLDPVGQALAGDMSALAGANFDTLPDTLLELLPDLEALSEKVAVPYQGGASAVTDEDLVLLAEAYNEATVLFNDIYTTANANGWMANADYAVELEEVRVTLGEIASALANDPSSLNVDETMEWLQNLISQSEDLAAQVSVPYGDEK